MRILEIHDKPLPDSWLQPPSGLIQASHGASNSFLGCVRNEHLGKTVTGIAYECYEDLAQAVMHSIADEVCAQWGDSCSIAIAHASGQHAVGDLVVAIHIAAPHRAAAFGACRHCIERIKQDLPVWKHEQYDDGSAAWLPGS